MTVCLAKLKLYIYNFIFPIVRGNAEIHVAVVEFHRQLIFFCFIYVLVTISKHENKRELKSNQVDKMKTSLHSPLNKRKGNWNRNASRSCFWDRTGDAPVS